MKLSTFIISSSTFDSERIVSYVFSNYDLLICVEVPKATLTQVAVTNIVNFKGRFLLQKRGLKRRFQNCQTFKMECFTKIDDDDDDDELFLWNC